MACDVSPVAMFFNDRQNIFHRTRQRCFVEQFFFGEPMFLSLKQAIAFLLFMNYYQIIFHQDFPKRVREHRAVLSRFAKEVQKIKRSALLLRCKRFIFRSDDVTPMQEFIWHGINFLSIHRSFVICQSCSGGVHVILFLKIVFIYHLHLAICTCVIHSVS